MTIHVKHLAQGLLAYSKHLVNVTNDGADFESSS